MRQEKKRDSQLHPPLVPAPVITVYLFKYVGVCMSQGFKGTF